MILYEILQCIIRGIILLDQLSLSVFDALNHCQIHRIAMCVWQSYVVIII